jgi:tripartite-type tricarboxylate transporter receptor subunit TctC
MFSHVDQSASSSPHRGLRRRKAIGAIAMAGAALAGSGQVFAQGTYPSQPIKLVIPYATGGVSDTIGRLIAQALGKALNATVVSENKGGAGGTLGAAAVAKAAPDGYTLLLTSPPMVAVAPAMLKELPYRTAEDFTMVGTFATTPNVLVVNNALPATSIAELVTYAKGEGKDKLSFASAGPGSTGHMSGQILMDSTGIRMEHVPYRSSAQAFPDVISGRVSMVFDSLPSTIGHVRANSVRPLLVMSEKRSSVLPDVPTAAEAGFPAATMNFWIGIEGPAKMAQPVVDKLSAALKTAVESRELRGQLAFFGAEPFYTDAAAFKALRQKDIDKYGVLVRQMGLKLN